MDIDHIFKLTVGVYKVTGLYPVEDPLRQKTREKSIKILADFVSASPNPGVRSLSEVKPVLLSDIEILESLFKVAESQDWTDKRNFEVLEREYSSFKHYLLETGKADPLAQKKPDSKPRQEKIAEFLRQGDGAAVRDIISHLGEGVSKRTLRRELGEMVQKGVVQRVGKCNQIFYRLA